jgi:hypothetical protein
MSNRFRIELLKRSLRRGPKSFFLEMLAMVAGSGPFISIVGYCKDCQDGLRYEGRRNSEIVFQNFKSWEEIPNTLQTTLTALDSRPEEGFESVLKKRGWRLWIGLIKDQVAIFLWTRSSQQSIDFFFPIGENSLLFWYGETLPAFRGLAIFPFLLDHVIQTVGTEGTESMFATCAVYNLASRGACDKNHFKMIGRGLMRAGTGRGLVWVPSKKLQFGEGDRN